MRYLIILPLALMLQSTVGAAEPVLTITPNKCVALRKGQTCYQQLNIKFIAPVIGEYCLRISDQAEPLRCWDGVESIAYQYRLASKTDMAFEIIDAADTKIASELVTIAWVYKKSQTRSRWRLF